MNLFCATTTLPYTNTCAADYVNYVTEPWRWSVCSIFPERKSRFYFSSSVFRKVNMNPFPSFSFYFPVCFQLNDLFPLPLLSKIHSQTHHTSAVFVRMDNDTNYLNDKGSEQKRIWNESVIPYKSLNIKDYFWMIFINN